MFFLIWDVGFPWFSGKHIGTAIMFQNRPLFIAARSCTVKNCLSDPVVTGLARPFTEYILISDYDLKHANLLTFGHRRYHAPALYIFVTPRLKILENICHGWLISFTLCWSVRISSFSMCFSQWGHVNSGAHLSLSTDSPQLGTHLRKIQERKISWNKTWIEYWVIPCHVGLLDEHKHWTLPAKNKKLQIPSFIRRNSIWNA